MEIKELSIQEFSDFEKNHPLSNYCQTINYAILMSEYNYDYELIGLKENDTLVAASLILIKKIGNLHYGYAPKGFLIDYTNKSLIEYFTKNLIEYFYEKELVFIKINPEIATGEIDLNTLKINYNENNQIKDLLTSCGYIKLKDNLYFESQFPRFNAFIPLSNFSLQKISKNTRNKIKKANRKGLLFKAGTKEDIDSLNTFTKNETFFLKDFYNVFSKTNDADLFIVSVDFEQYLINSQNLYIKESDNNQILNEKMIKNSNSKNINKKMNSDMTLLMYKKDIMEASKLIEDNKNIILAVALVVKHNNSVKIIASGYNKKYKRYVPNYFLYYNIMKHYKTSHNRLDLNGISGDFSLDSPYKGLNEFKFGFNPKSYEFIGEFDLIIEENAYNYLLKSGLLAKEFKNNSLKLKISK